MKRRHLIAVTAAALAVVAILATTGGATAGLSDLYKSEDWRIEKHAPAILCPDEFGAGETTPVTVSVGEEIPHPNTTDHHIRWIRLYFMPEGGPYAYEIGHFEFNAHGASTEGPDTSTLYTRPKVTLEFRTEVPGTLYATSFCNIHGPWESSKEIAVRE
jgi:superoxide reductase